MKKVILFILLCGFVFQSQGYDRKSLVERFTNTSCGPCASINNAWYNATTTSLLNSNTISQIIYNGWWPGANDPMYLLNLNDNTTRISYYGVNAVPWIEINGATFNTASGSAVFTNTITTGNTQFSPFEIIITPERFSNDVIDVHIRINRDISDNTILGNNVKLKVALTEKTVAYPSPPGSNGESVFYSVSRKMLPDAKGITFEIPAPGASTELNLLYIPTADFLNKVNLDSIRVVAFIQNNENKYIYQSEMEELTLSESIIAAFTVDENLGATPFEVSFTDYSIGSNSSNIVSWEWDFDNDGTVDSYDQNPVWVYNEIGNYSVKLTVNDGSQQHSRTLTNLIETITNVSNILVVNGMDFVTYPAEMTQFYNASACFGSHQVDVWDLFGDQGFDYSTNSDILHSHLYNRDIPNSILNLYDKVIWIGNNYSGDLSFFNPNQVLNYISGGGHFLLATRMASNFFNTDLRNYTGIVTISGDMTGSELLSLDENLVDMTGSTTNTFTHFVTLNDTSEAIPIFDENLTTDWIGGFRIQKRDEGAFIFIAGRPYRYDFSASYQNYDYIIENWMYVEPTNIEEDENLNISLSFNLSQNFPNPFNPSTKITYSIPNSGFVTLKIYNVLGKEVQTLVNGYQQAGIFEVNFNAGNLASGIYFYKLHSGTTVDTKKMILIK